MAFERYTKVAQGVYMTIDLAVIDDRRCKKVCVNGL